MTINVPNKDEPENSHKFTFRLPGGDKDAPDRELRLVFNEFGWRLYSGDNLLGDCARSGIPQLYKFLDQSWAETPYKMRKYIEH